MAAARKSEPSEPESAERVLVAFAYATAKNGEVVQLVKGDVIDGARFKGDSLVHLRSIGFIGSGE